MEENKEIQNIKEQETEEFLPDELSEALEEMSPEVRKHVEIGRLQSHWL